VKDFTKVAGQNEPSLPSSGRWKYTGAFLAAVVMFLANVPGQFEISHLDVEQGYPFEYFDSVNHGWPWIYSRKAQSLPYWSYDSSTETIGELTTSEVWNPFARGGYGSRRIEVRIRAAVLDAFVACLGVILGGVVFSWFGRRHVNWRQFSIRQLLASMAMAGSIFGYVAVHYRYFQVQERVLADLREFDSDSFFDGRRICAQIRPGGPTWLRRLGGDAFFQWFDEVVSLDVSPDALPLCTPLSSIRRLIILGTANGDEGKTLQAFPNLEVLDLSQMDARRVASDMTLLEKWVRGYNCRLWHDLSHVRTLRRLNWVKWHDAELLDEAAPAMPRFADLEVLDLSGTSLGGKFVQVMPELRSLRCLWTVDATAIDSLLEFPEFKDLYYPGSKISPHGSLDFDREDDGGLVVRW
jgi:hypothetical protein